MTIEEFKEYKKYLRSMSQQDLLEHTERLMMAMYSLEEENESLRRQCSRMTSHYLSGCRSVGGVTLPPGV